MGVQGVLGGEGGGICLGSRVSVAVVGGVVRGGCIRVRLLGCRGIVAS